MIPVERLILNQRLQQAFLLIKAAAPENSTLTIVFRHPTDPDDVIMYSDDTFPRLYESIMNVQSQMENKGKDVRPT